MEQQMRFYQADLIEHATEYLQYRMEHWILDGRPLTEDIKNFVAWCREQDKNDLHCKRGKDGKSFVERREEAKTEVKRKYEEYLNMGKK
jgi:hypothetical protein